MLLLRNIELDDETARDFALSVRNIRKLKMHGVELSSVGMEYLSNAITLLSEPVRNFNLLPIRNNQHANLVLLSIIIFMYHCNFSAGLS